MPDLQIENEPTIQLRQSSMQVRVQNEMRIPSLDEDEQPRVEELELSSATYTKLLARICTT